MPRAEPSGLRAAALFISLGNAPGAIPVTTMLSLISRAAIRLVRWISPAFEAWYG